MKEQKVELYVRKYLEQKGWICKGSSKKRGQQGVDIYAFHRHWSYKTMWIEAKGGSGKHPYQEKHGAFCTLLGQCLFRMDIEGNHSGRNRTYAIAIPKAWEGPYKDKIKKMKFGWSLLKLRVFLVEENGEVKEKTYKTFLK